MLLLVLFLISAILIAYYIKVSVSKQLYWKKKGVKYIKPIPVLGNLLPLVTKSMSMAEVIHHFYKAFPEERYFGVYQFNTPILIIKDPELIKSVTIKNFENFVDHTGFVSEEIDPLWGKNIFASKGERWRDLRQTLSPVFTSNKMRKMFVLMDECAQQLINYLENGRNNDNIIDVELRDLFTRYTNDVIATTAFGIKCDSLKNKNNEFLLAGRELADMTGLRRFIFLLYEKNPTICKLLGLKMITDRVGNFFRAIINETISLRESNQIVRPDLIHLLMLARKGKLKYEDYLNTEADSFVDKESEVSQSDNFLTNEDITAQALVFFLGGFDTTANSLCFTSYELAVNPDIQKKLKSEIASIAQKNNGKIDYESLFTMKYLDMVVCETIRKWPQGIWLDRRCTKDFEIYPTRDGENVVRIKEGDVCWVPVFGIHRDPKYYPNPEVFDPERFSEENKDKIQTSTYLPFGLGPRNCIGSRYALLATKIQLYYLLLHFDFVVTSKTQIPLKIARDSPFLQAESGYHIGLKPNKIKY